MDKHQNFRHSLCWDCKNAVTLGCSWADRFEPVPGWTAVATQKKTFGVQMESYRVEACPEFIRDAKNFGLKRMEENENAELRGRTGKGTGDGRKGNHTERDP